MNEIMDTIERLLEKGIRSHLQTQADETSRLRQRSCLARGQDAASSRHLSSKIHVLSEMNKTIACSVTRAEEELGYKPTVALRRRHETVVALVRRKRADF